MKSIYSNYKIDAEIKNTKEQYYFIFNQRKLLIINNTIPLISDLNQLNINEDNIKNKMYLGEFYSKDSYIIELNEIDKIINSDSNNLKDSNSNLNFVELRDVYDINEEIYLIAGRAIQLLDWENNHQYCGRCGAKTVDSKWERAKVCPECGFRSFTRISPAIITTIIKEEIDEEGNVENKLLMATHSYHRVKKPALLAGFMEVGETIEEAVHREVMEEVGIEIEDLKYFGSQSWPYPNSLMIAFVCKYKSGEIEIDNHEIVDARWFSKDEIELRDSNISISSQLIKNFIENY
ncbi:MAG: NAD(+) diphosphatase [Methanobacteriaceae archaeon]|nr:NAD(+) diphosphatase [Methanobacteriaceae archaeon]